ncbi:hypothetical protein D3C83_25570 [compost metagenome]
MDALRRELDDALAFERPAGLVEHDHVARARLRPVQAEGQDQVAVVAPRHGDGEVVVDALLQLVEHGEAVRGGEMDLRLPDGIDGAGGGKLVHGHGGSPQGGGFADSIARRSRRKCSAAITSAAACSAAQK